LKLASYGGRCQKFNTIWYYNIFRELALLFSSEESMIQLTQASL